MSRLILVRHAKSEWNELGRWTGWTDIALSEEGRVQAVETARQLSDLPIHRAYSSSLKRAKETLSLILEALNLSLTPIAHESLDERNYGIFTGRNKWEIKKELGDEEFQKLRRGWNVSIPDGETLLDVYERVVPYFLERILPELQSERTVLIVAHGNSLRALVKYLQNLNSEELAALEIGVGEAYIYAFDEAGKAVLEEVRAEYPDKMNV